MIDPQELQSLILPQLSFRGLESTARCDGAACLMDKVQNRPPVGRPPAGAPTSGASAAPATSRTSCEAWYAPCARAS